MDQECLFLLLQVEGKGEAWGVEGVLGLRGEEGEGLKGMAKLE